jgi:hypothetical protein
MRGLSWVEDESDDRAGDEAEDVRRSLEPCI